MERRQKDDYDANVCVGGDRGALLPPGVIQQSRCRRPGF